jgi:hypothetical protein
MKISKTLSGTEPATASSAVPPTALTRHALTATIFIKTLNRMTFRTHINGRDNCFVFVSRIPSKGPCLPKETARQQHKWQK